MKKLIEVALPLAEINDASAYDKMPGIGPHPKGIHQWWARLPLPTARAVLFASVVDDPSAHPEKFPTEETQNAERERLFDLLRQLMQKKMHEHPEIYARAQAEMLKYCDGKLPPVLDPFAGGGSIPLEAARLGFEAHAADLNPVAVLLNKCNLELIPRWLDQTPVNPESHNVVGSSDSHDVWRGSRGLANDVRYYGRIVLERTRQKIGHLYPKVSLIKEGQGLRYATPSETKEKNIQVIKADVIAWLWARTVASPNPAAQGAHVPLMSTFWLSSKNGVLTWLQPVVDHKKNTWRFEVRTGEPPDRNAVKQGTKLGRGSQFRCLLTETPMPDEHIRQEVIAKRCLFKLTAIVVALERSRTYLPADDRHAAIAVKANPSWQPDEEMNENDSNLISGRGYGIKKWAELFTPRQLAALVTFSDQVKEVRQDILIDARKAGLSARDADEYAKTVTTFLGINLSRCTDLNNILTTWNSHDQVVRNLFKRQAIPMVWDFAEPNILGDVVGGWSVHIERTTKCMQTIEGKVGSALQIDAASAQNDLRGVLVSTDPPYYANIGYAALSDFFYVWLRKTVGDLYPDLFTMILTPKATELVAASERFDGDREKASEHFETGFRKAFAALREKIDPRFPLTVYYAYKQEDEEAGSEEPEAKKKERETGGRNSVDLTTGWETLLEALLGSGFQITATWPVRASQKWRMVAMGTNALASYIVLACRPRPKDAPQCSRREFITQLKKELPLALKHLQQGNIAPVDLAQASIGPGMAAFSRYAKVMEASGRAMTVRTALTLINQTLDEVLAEQEADFDADTRWALAWFEQHGMEEGPFGDAETLSKAKNTALRSMVDAGIVLARSGKVRLVSREELGSGREKKEAGSIENLLEIVTPACSVWLVTQCLVRAMENGGETGAVTLLGKIGVGGETARELCYRLHKISEKRGWTSEALSYNALAVAWPEISRLASLQKQEGKSQGELFEGSH